MSRKGLGCCNVLFYWLIPKKLTTKTQLLARSVSANYITDHIRQNNDSCKAVQLLRRFRLYKWDRWIQSWIYLPNIPRVCWMSQQFIVRKSFATVTHLLTYSSTATIVVQLQDRILHLTWRAHRSIKKTVNPHSKLSVGQSFHKLLVWTLKTVIVNWRQTVRVKHADVRRYNLTSWLKVLSTGACPALSLSVWVSH